MKTLDEVIKALEVCTSDHGGCDGCPYDPDCTPDYKWDDAIFYLKEYRDYRNTNKTVIEDGSVSDAENEPLTWDELCKMEATPVWLEWSSDRQWVLIAYSVYNDIKFFRYCDDRCFTLTRDEYGPDKWQAYRKERE